MATEEELRAEAIKAVKRKREFKNHVIAYIIVNAFLVVVWYFAGAGYFWPAWVMGGWGIGVAFNAWEVYGRTHGAISEAEIQREIDRQKGAGGA
jgi:hypothetical protein